MSEIKVSFFSTNDMVLSGELHFELKIRHLGNCWRGYEFVFRVLRKGGIISRNVFKQSRKNCNRLCKVSLVRFWGICIK